MDNYDNARPEFVDDDIQPNNSQQEIVDDVIQPFNDHQPEIFDNSLENIAQPEYPNIGNPTDNQIWRPWLTTSDIDQTNGFNNNDDEFNELFYLVHGLYPSQIGGNSEVTPPDDVDETDQLNGDLLEPLSEGNNGLNQMDIDPSDNSVVKYHVLSQSDHAYPDFYRDLVRRNIRFHHNLKSINDLGQLDDEIADLYKSLVSPVFNGHRSEDFYCVIIRANGLSNPIYLGGRKISEFDKYEFGKKLFKITQSNQEFLMSSFELSVYITRAITGSGNKRKRAPETREEKSKRKRCVVSIKNKDWDRNCGYRAIWIGYAYIYEEIIGTSLSDNNLWRKIIAKGYSDDTQYRMSKELCENAGLQWGVPFGEEHWRRMQDYLYTLYDKKQELQGFQLFIVNAGKSKNFLFKGDIDCTNQIFIEYIDNDNGEGHYNFIKDINEYYEDSDFCKHCSTSHHKINHKCELVCNHCGKYPKCQAITLVDCDDCGKTYLNEQCLQNHIDNFVCQSMPKYCEKCEVTYKYNKQYPHKCNEILCKNCRKYYKTSPHYCMLRPLNSNRLEKEDEKPKFIVCFDIECTQNNINGKDYHLPNLLISKCVCNVCWDEEAKKKNCDQSIDKPSDGCSVCGYENRGFFQFDVVERFCNYLYNDVAKRAEAVDAQVYVFAHNFKGYDGHFILQDYYNREFTDAMDIIMTGMKLLKMDISNISFIDSLSFFQQPLSALPKSFGFENIVIKGFFPHHFNKPEYYMYDDVIPDIKYFGIEDMKPAAAKACQEWHQQMVDNNYNWNFKAELLRYCYNDVQILLLAVMEFRKLFQTATDLDPITRRFTLAGVGLEYFRAKILNENTIGVTPINGYIDKRNKSIGANIWLDYKQKQLKKPIARETKIGPYYADGYIEEDRHIFEYNGCYWHACEDCFPDLNSNTKFEHLNNLTPNEKRTKDFGKLRYFERQGYKVTLIWEHEFKNDLNTDEQLRQYYPSRLRYYEKMKIIGHVDIRESFYGGRTNNLFFNDDCEDNEVIKYKDVCSLYPTVLSKCEYPIGHPIVLSEFTSKSIDGYFGFIKCKVLPPKDLYLPVLPMRLENNKLVFALCGLCASNKIDHCTHTDRERCLVGTWYSEELKLAITKGYKIEKIYEALHYEQKTDDIFKEYINKWLKIKTEASGWPSNCITNEEKENYITEYKVRENVELEFDKMEKNPGLRFIAKLMLNSLWGKLAQRPNQTQTKICTQYDDYRRIITDAKYVIKGEIMPNEKTIIVNYKCIDDSYCNAGSTSFALGSMVTANARIHLYKELDLIESSSAGRVKYFDTDSVIYKHNLTKNWYDPITGDFLGDMTDEIEKDYGCNAYIDSFASCGPKNYGYRVRLPNGSFINKCKVKGIAITNELKDEINFELIAKTAENYFINQIFTTTAKQLCFRTDKVHNVYTEKINKLYRAVSEKRAIVTYHPYYQTIPFGYVDEFTE